MKTKPRPKTKIPKHVEIVPDIYSDYLFPDTSLNLLESMISCDTGIGLYNIIYCSKQWLAEGGRG